MNINVGCGTNGKYKFEDLNCEVNCDVDKPRRKIKGFVRCDIQFMPFQSKVFEKSFALSVFEHIKNIRLGIKELIRITKGSVVIKTPHRFSIWAKMDKTHINFFDIEYFRKLLRNYKHDIVLTRNLSVLPSEIVVTIYP